VTDTEKTEGEKKKTKRGELTAWDQKNGGSGGDGISSFRTKERGEGKKEGKSRVRRSLPAQRPESSGLGKRKGGERGRGPPTSLSSVREPFILAHRREKKKGRNPQPMWSRLRPINSL